MSQSKKTPFSSCSAFLLSVWFSAKVSKQTERRRIFVIYCELIKNQDPHSQIENDEIPGT